MASIDKQSIYAKAVMFSVGKTKEARFVISDYKGYTRLSVFIKDKGSRDKAKMVGNIAANRIGIYSFLEKLESLNKAEDGYNFAVDLYMPEFIDNKQTTGIVMTGSIGIGRKKDSNGSIINYIELEISAKGTGAKTKYIFKLMPTPYVKYRENNAMLNDEATSKLWTKSVVRNLNDMMAMYLEATDVVKDENGNGPNTGYYNKNKVIAKPDASNNAPDIDLSDLM